MDIVDEIEIFDCPICHGPGVLEDENGWCLYVTCMDCGTHTAEVSYNNAEERIAAAKRIISRWNVGKVIPAGPGD